MNKLSALFGSLAVLFLGLSLYAPPSWYEWILTRAGDPVVAFPALCATFTLVLLAQIPLINKYLMRKGILVDPSRKD